MPRENLAHHGSYGKTHKPVFVRFGGERLPMSPFFAVAREEKWKTQKAPVAISTDTVIHIPMTVRLVSPQLDATPRKGGTNSLAPQARNHHHNPSRQRKPLSGTYDAQATHTLPAFSSRLYLLLYPLHLNALIP
jgi:hypothetical protein